MTKELKDAEFSDLEDTLFKKELTYSEIEKILDTKYIATSSTKDTLPTGT